MISQLTGILVEKSFTEVVIDVNGVGYNCLIPLSTFDNLPMVGDQLKLFTHMHVREDAMQLYGFNSKDERQLYLMLVQHVSGIGPKLALSALSCMSVSSFCRAVEDNDVKTLSKISGVGRRSAERLVVELREKLKIAFPKMEMLAGLQPVRTAGKNVEDAVSALLTLGVRSDSIRDVVSQVAQTLPETECSAENLIRHALAELKK